MPIFTRLTQNAVAFLLFATTTTALLQQASAQTLDPKYFANESVQRLAPEAFALQPEAGAFHQFASGITRHEAEKLIVAIESDAKLQSQILNFANLDTSKKTQVLKDVFAVEVKALGIIPPTLTIDSTSIPGEAYFEFDIQNPGPGKVFINLDKIARAPNPHLGLLLLIHETRHAKQFQLAFLAEGNPSTSINGAHPLANGFRAAFTAQKNLNLQIRSFSDFLTLLNEYEAFQFSNYVMMRLLIGQVDTLGLGTYASQFDANLNPIIDLPKMFKDFNIGTLGDSILNAFNLQEMAQYKRLKP